MYNFIHYFYTILALMVGCCVGSFINVVIYRLPVMVFNCGESETMTLSFPSSHCPHCKNKVYKRDNIPIISWFILSGKCRHCYNKISKVYPFSEFIFGVIFSGLIWAFYPSCALMPLILFLGLFSICYAIIFIDLKWYIIPDELNYLLIWLGLLGSVMNWTSVSPTHAVLGCIIIWLLIKSIMKIFKWATGKEGMGDGDAKLFSACASFIGVAQIHWLILFSALFGLLIFFTVNYFNYVPDRGKYAVYYEIDEKYHIPFGPAICLAVLLLYFYNEII